MLHRSCGGPTQIWLAEIESPLGGVRVTVAAAVTAGARVTGAGGGAGVSAGGGGVVAPPPESTGVPTPVNRPILAGGLSGEPLNQTLPLVSGATSYGW